MVPQRPPECFGKLGKILGVQLVVTLACLLAGHLYFFLHVELAKGKGSVVISEYKPTLSTTYLEEATSCPPAVGDCV